MGEVWRARDPRSDGVDRAPRSAMRRFTFPTKQSIGVSLCALTFVLSDGCARSGEEKPLSTAERPLHLADHLDKARVEESDVPKTIPAAIEWRFDQPQPGWKALTSLDPARKGSELTRIGDALRVTIPAQQPRNDGFIYGGIYVEVPHLRPEEWAEVLVRARSRDIQMEQMERDVRTDEFTGHIEMIDGRWGASLEIWPRRGPNDPPVQPSRWRAKARFHVDGQPRLLLYDLWEDPFTRQNVNARYPELVRKYTRLLEAQWREHQAVAALYHPGGQSRLTPEQVQTLKSLGYIR